MKKIGGIFPLETTCARDNGFFGALCPPGGDLAFMMSGRCGLYYALEDILRRDVRRVAYLPLYTCETVVAPFAKAGYTLKFYDVDEALRPVFDHAMLEEISLISLCGYYGFCGYDRGFVRACRDRGIVVLEDATHSLLSADGIDPLCDYVAGSFRKWLGVPAGGFAIKAAGAFEAPPLPPHARHLELRRQAIAGADDASFWEGELLLREIFDSFSGDSQSEHVLRHANLAGIRGARRRNYAALEAALGPLRGVRPVFPALAPQTVPSHFPVYAEDREGLQAYLRRQEIGSTVYWPVGPLVDLTGHPVVHYIYDHILSIPCDQRYQPEDMERVAAALSAYQGT